MPIAASDVVRRIRDQALDGVRGLT